MHARGSLPGPAVCMPLIPYLGPGRMRALRLAAASCHPAAVLRCAPLRTSPTASMSPRPEHSAPPPRAARASRGHSGPQGVSLSPPRLRRRRAQRAQLCPGIDPESGSKANGIASHRSPAARVARPPWASIRSIPLTSSPAPPPRPSRPALTWPRPRERLNGIAGTSTLRRARGPPIPQPRGPRSQAPRRRRPPLQKSSYCSHSPPEGTLAS